MRHYKRKISTHSNLLANESFHLKHRGQKKAKNQNKTTHTNTKKQSLSDLWDIILDKLTNEIEFLGAEWEKDQKKYI